MATINGLTAEAMEEIRDAVIIDADIVGDDLILTKYDGSTINVGNVRGPAGTGTTPAGPAGGDLTGTYPNPTVEDKDGPAGTPSMRTLGTGSAQAAAGNHSHAGLADTGVVDMASLMVAGEEPFDDTTWTRATYRKFGPLVSVRLERALNAAIDQSESTGNFGNVEVAGAGSLPASIRPTVTGVECFGSVSDSPNTFRIGTDGSVKWVGGLPRNYASGLPLIIAKVYMTTAT